MTDTATRSHRKVEGGADQLECPECGEMIAGKDYRGARIALGMHRRRKHGVEGEKKGGASAPVPDEPAPADAELLDAPDPDSLFAEQPAPSAEIPPTPSERARSVEPPRRRGLLAGLRRRREPAEPAAAPGPERAPKKAKAPSLGRRGRLSAAETIAEVWGGTGALMARAGHVPTGRMLQWQGPAAGVVLDAAIAGTPFDRIVVQRLVGARGTLDAVVALAAPPALVWQMEKAIAEGDQARAAGLAEALKLVTRRALPVLVPAMKKAREAERAQAVAFAEMLDPADLSLLGLVVGDDGRPVDADGRLVDPADVFVELLFAEWVPAPPAPGHDEEEPANV